MFMLDGGLNKTKSSDLDAWRRPYQERCAAAKKKLGKTAIGQHAAENSQWSERLAGSER